MIALALTACSLWSTSKVTLRFLQFFQQEEYDTLRFLRWWMRSKSLEPRLTLAAFGGMVALALDHAWALGFDWWLAPALGLLSLAVGFWLPLAPSKKPLKVTARVQRLIAASALTQASSVFCLASVALEGSEWWGAWLGLLYFAQLVLIPVWIVLGNVAVMPLEALIRWRYRRQAQQQLARCHPLVVGITGSYGKTSTKHLVAQVLRSQAPVLHTPGSVNTLMGITRVIREELLPDHRYFVVEMGAYRPGSIRALCELTPPQVAVLTEIGLAHLERFGSIETVAEAKSELPQALGPDGWFIYNADNPYCRLVASRIRCRKLSFGWDAAQMPDLLIERADQLPHGLEITIRYEGRCASGTLPVHGLHQAQNAAAALAVGITQQIPLIQGLAALRHAAPTPHRCSVSQVDGVTWIDDSYNSNPTGFRNALEVLKSLPGKRGILVTPGMVELGRAHSDEHRALAQSICASCQHVCLVAPGRISSLQEALQEAGLDESRLHTFATFAAAREWLLQHLEVGDKVLLENDLPDLHERTSAFEELGRGKR
jgi:UDP-N-acetylmuramoyl-tripeptide--D-alanyl-D-alanine ligase